MNGLSFFRRCVVASVFSVAAISAGGVVQGQSPANIGPASVPDQEPTGPEIPDTAAYAKVDELLALRRGKLSRETSFDQYPAGRFYRRVSELLAQQVADHRCGGYPRSDPETIEQASDPRWLSRDVVVRATVEKTEFRPIERIPIRFEAENVSTSTVRINRDGNPHIDCPVLVFDSRGRLVSRTQFGRTDGARANTFVPVGGGLGYGLGGELAPGFVFDAEQVANLVNDMTMPGEYTIFVRVLVDEIKDGENARRAIYAQSEPIKVKIVGSHSAVPFIGPGWVLFDFDPSRPGLVENPTNPIRKKAERDGKED
ncbi:hypothetical protein P12x_000156 [Tundrisphaera lichenicola]|uniref:hypothetical protein n=1 Tax=Tundrisphaera lichenicola TaxID=2029860 RepID=UPI003EB78F5A